jgi:hypothetical protein
MALDDTRMNEIVQLLDEIYDCEVDKAEEIATHNVRIKDAKNTLEEWGKANEVDPKNLLGVYDQYKKARNGKIQWTEDDQEYGDLLFNVMEKALAK